jgi:hypothetical protein
MDGDLSRRGHCCSGTQCANTGYSAVVGKNALLREDFRRSTLALELVLYAGKLSRPDLSPFSSSAFDNASPHQAAEHAYYVVDVRGGDG